MGEIRGAKKKELTRWFPVRCPGREQEEAVPTLGLKPLEVSALKLRLLSWSPSPGSQWVQQTPERFHSSPQEDTIRGAWCLLPPESQEFLYNRGSDTLEAMSSTDKEMKMVMLDLTASTWSAGEEGTIKNNITSCQQSLL